MIGFDSKKNGSELEELKILVIDEDEENLTDIDKYLASEQLQVKYLDDSTMALEELEEFCPDIVIIEIKSENQIGLDICRLIRAKRRFVDTSIIFSTDDYELIGEAFDAGANEFLRRPIQKMEIVGRLNNLMRLKKSKNLQLEELEGEKNLVRILSHDIANPMGNLLVGINKLKKMFGKDNEDSALDLIKIGKMLDRMLKGYSRIIELAGLVKELQDLLHKGSKIPLGPVNLIDVLIDVEAIFHEKLKAKNVAMQSNMDEFDEIFVVAERKSLLYTVINNVVSNAIKFSEPISNITLNLEDRGEQWELRIKDTGIGMPKSLLSKVFDKAAKTSRPGTQGEKGTGFGMPLVREYMLQYGGDISVESVSVEDDPENHGTTMVLTFLKKLPK